MKLVRLLQLALMVGGALLIAAPFVLSSRYIDARGVEIQGRVFEKREYVNVQDSEWERICEVTAVYTPPDEYGTPYLVERLGPAAFDGLHKGGPVTLRYLRREDLPRVPGSKVLREMRLLRAAKMAGRIGIDPNVKRALWWVGLGVLLLSLWRMARLPGFAWLAGGAVAVLLAATLNSEFPWATPAPRSGIRSADGRVVSVGTISRLFSGHQTSGMQAEQPIQVIAVQFFPAGKTEPVLAIDLIDEGSIAGLKEGAAARVQYEDSAPRVARVEGGTREFPSRNLYGVFRDSAVTVAVLAAIFTVVALAGKALGRVFSRRLPTGSIARPRDKRSPES